MHVPVSGGPGTILGVSSLLGGLTGLSTWPSSWLWGLPARGRSTGATKEGAARGGAASGESCPAPEGPPAEPHGTRVVHTNVCVKLASRSLLTLQSRHHWRLNTSTALTRVFWMSHDTTESCLENGVIF